MLVLDADKKPSDPVFLAFQERVWKFIVQDLYMVPAEHLQMTLVIRFKDTYHLKHPT